MARSTALTAVQLYPMLDEEIVGKRRWDGRKSGIPYFSDMSGKQNVPDNCLKPSGDYDIIPVSAQVDSDEPLNLEYVRKEMYDRIIQKEAHEKPFDGPRRDSLGYITQQDLDLEKGEFGQKSENPPPQCNPVIDNFTVPKLVPIYRHVKRVPDENAVSRNQNGSQQTDAVVGAHQEQLLLTTGQQSVQTGTQEAVRTGAEKAANSRELAVVEGAYELVMTYGYRKQLRVGKKAIRWKSIVESAVSETLSPRTKGTAYYRKLNTRRTATTSTEM